MRFYGNERLALYRAHAKKDRDGIDEDGILGALGPETTVIHDHVNPNKNKIQTFFWNPARILGFRAKKFGFFV